MQKSRIRSAGADVKKKGRGKRPVPSFIYREQRGCLRERKYEINFEKSVDMCFLVWYYNQAVARDSEPLKS